jgi:ribonucleoside-triphosphate reductase
VLKAVSSPLRLQILNLLSDRGPLSYTELMSSLKMNPSRDAGRFAYHLKSLLKADLAEVDVEARKYCLTELGKMVIDVADRVEKNAVKSKEILVRTSRSTLEEFDANRIANSLLRESRMPPELAQKVAKEAEKRLLRSKTKYLTAPLVREVVNAILIEKGLEEYRHKLTRLGLPVYEVAALIEARSRAAHESASIHETAGEAVLREYMLLNTFPRDIADAHLSGSLHIRGLSSWTLKTSEIMHDLRFFFKNGLDLEKTDPSQAPCSPPENLESALAMTFNVLLHSAKEVSEMQTLDYFNIFLAPFARGMDPSAVKKALRLFISNLSQHSTASLGLEFTIPDFVAEKPAIGPSGKQAGDYGGYAEETQTLTSAILEVLAEQSTAKPLYNPRIIVKIRPETFTDPRASALFLKTHQLAAEKGIPYFASLLGKSQTQSVFSASGCTLDTDLKKDWEIDTLRTGCTGCVTVNLPRIACECEKDRTKFFQTLRERLEMAVRALEIKHRALRQHGTRLLPFLMQDSGGDRYLRLENCSSLINLVGLKETAQAFYGKDADGNKRSLELNEEIANETLAFIGRGGRKLGKRLYQCVLPDPEASERLAQLDIERYGIAKVRFSGTRDKPFYSTTAAMNLQDGTIPAGAIEAECKASRLHAGGNMTVVEVEGGECRAEELADVTTRILETGAIRFFTYNRKLTYCTSCKRSWFGLLQKCPTCGAVSTLEAFDKSPQA